MAARLPVLGRIATELLQRQHGSERRRRRCLGRGRAGNGRSPGTVNPLKPACAPRAPRRAVLDRPIPSIAAMHPAPCSHPACRPADPAGRPSRRKRLIVPFRHWHAACAYPAQTDRKSLRPCYRRGPPCPSSFARSSCLFCLLASLPAAAQVRIKDIADVEGVRENQLVGYGLVVGLNNTGDKLDNVGVHPRIADRHAGAAGREHPRPGRQAVDQERCRGDGHRRTARLRHAAAAGSMSPFPRSATPPI